MAVHLHRAFRYRSMAKPDCVSITCRCGVQASVGTWYLQPPAGWDPEHWRLHGHRKVVGCDRRGRRHVRRLHRLRARRDERAGTK